jgi:hypothetical protein
MKSSRSQFIAVWKTKGVLKVKPTLKVKVESLDFPDIDVNELQLGEDLFSIEKTISLTETEGVLARSKISELYQFHERPRHRLNLASIKEPFPTLGL